MPLTGSGRIKRLMASNSSAPVTACHRFKCMRMGSAHSWHRMDLIHIGRHQAVPGAGVAGAGTVQSCMPCCCCPGGASQAAHPDSDYRDQGPEDLNTVVPKRIRLVAFPRHGPRREQRDGKSSNIAQHVGGVRKNSNAAGKPSRKCKGREASEPLTGRIGSKHYALVGCSSPTHNYSARSASAAPVREHAAHDLHPHEDETEDACNE